MRRSPELPIRSRLPPPAFTSADLPALLFHRSVVELSPLLPTPKDGIVTPVSFRVKRRGLRGFLAEADAQETGKREITGEWVINKRMWRRMQTEFATKKTVPQDGRVILYLHGGESNSRRPPHRRRKMADLSIALQVHTTS